jgi:hypothetical protein
MPAPPTPQQPEIALAATVAHAPVKTDVVWSTFAKADHGKHHS